MFLGRKPHTAGNTIRYEVDYSNWLADGVSLTSATVVLTPAFTATVKDITITGVQALVSHMVVFTMAGGSLNETFTLDVQVVDNRGETKNDTVGFNIVAP